MRLHSWLLSILGVVCLAAAGASLLPRTLRFHPPSAGEAAILAALGIGSLTIAVLFVRSDRRELQLRRASERDAARAAELVESGAIADFVASTRLPCVRLEEVPGGGPDAFGTTLGGTFYVPPGFAWPLTPERQPMWPLAQLNFAELPHLEGFPDRGIVQFFIAGDDDLHGMDLDDLTSPSGFRVVFHPEVGDTTLPNPAQPPSEERLVPLDRPLGLSGHLSAVSMAWDDWRFDAAFAESWTSSGRPGEPSAEVLRAAAQAIGTSPDDLGEPLTGHRIGGHPFFTQEDPRTRDPRLQGHSVLLLQIDSTEDVNWGDAGTACFLIEPERLARRDFSHVLYSWDSH